MEESRSKKRKRRESESKSKKKSRDVSAIGEEDSEVKKGMRDEDPTSIADDSVGDGIVSTSMDADLSRAESPSTREKSKKSKSKDKGSLREHRKEKASKKSDLEPRERQHFDADGDRRKIHDDPPDLSCQSREGLSGKRKKKKSQSNAFGGSGSRVDEGTSGTNDHQEEKGHHFSEDDCAVRIKSKESKGHDSPGNISSNDGCNRDEDPASIADDSVGDGIVPTSTDADLSRAESPPARKKSKKSKLKDKGSLGEHRNEKASKKGGFEPGERQHFDTDSDRSKIHDDPPDLSCQSREGLSGKRKKKKSQSNAFGAAGSKVDEGISGTNDRQEEKGLHFSKDDCAVRIKSKKSKLKGHQSLRSFSSDDGCREKKPARSLDPSSSVSDASGNDKKKGKVKSKRNETLKDNVVESGSGDGELRSSDSKQEENQKATQIRTKKEKKVTFSDRDEVFPTMKETWHSGNQPLIVGRRYTEEEDQILKDAIGKYLQEHGLDADDWGPLFSVRENRHVKNCWSDINEFVPWRTRNSIYVRANNLFGKTRKGKWTDEEVELIKRYRMEHGKGCRWSNLSDLLGRHRIHIKDAWRRHGLPNAKKGHWSQDEYQKLFDLVNMDYRMKAFDKQDVRNLMIRDNISWTAISTAMATRNNHSCCNKWYISLISPMVAQGLWDHGDDYRLVHALLKADASCEEDVDWENIVENRSGDVSRKRWKEMQKHIGEKKERSFMEQVELLSTRYSEDMPQYRFRKAEPLKGWEVV